METIRLLIVEKNSKVRQALEARLSSSSHIEVVGTARGAAEGIRRYPELKPDVMLLDARTAGRPKDIADVVSELRQQGPGVIVLTSYATEREREAALDSGAARYLLKDIDSAALISEIESLGKSSIQAAEG
ncbi:MAG: response regulator transcription factor [Anaerolineales bacterium]